MRKILKGKKILITAGSTWVPIDTVRVITNIFGGKLGLMIAETAHQMGADVTLLLGAGRAVLFKKSPRKLKIIYFKYFKELFSLLKKEVGSKKYDIVIHSAAVSDYTPTSVEKRKIKSGKKSLIIRLKPTIKIVDRIKKWDPNIFLIKFKLEVGLKEKKLIAVAYKSMISSNADIIVANDLKKMDKEHIAFVIDKNKKVIRCKGKKEIVKKILYTVKSLI